MPKSVPPRALAAAFVALATLAAFWPCLGLGFVNVDDPDFLFRPHRGLAPSAVLGVFTGFHFSNYAPLSLLSLSLDFELWGLEPRGYHLTNLLLHAANAAVFFFLCLELPWFRDEKSRARAVAAAAAAALFFALHPLRVQSVAWVSERRDALCGLFFLLSLLSWARGRRGAALAAHALALGAKAAAIPLPLVLVLLDYHRDRRLRPWREYLPFAALSAAAAALAVAAQSAGGAVVDGASAAPLQRLNQIAISQVFYLGKLLWPSGLAFYEWRWAPVRPAVLLGGAATALLLVLAARSRRLRAPLLAALAYQALLLAPTAGFVTIGHELVADRYSYLSGLAWAALFGAVLGEAARRRPAAWAAGAVLLAALAAATRAQLPVWADSVALWRQVLRVDPVHQGARPGLAAGLGDRGRHGEAILYLDEHLRFYPDDAAARAQRERLEALAGTKDRARFHAELAAEFEASGEAAKAAWHRERARGGAR